MDHGGSYDGENLSPFYRISARFTFMFIVVSDNLHNYHTGSEKSIWYLTQCEIATFKIGVKCVFSLTHK
jgi:hypothetical protein